MPLDHFSGEETEVQRISDLPKVIPASDKARALILCVLQFVSYKKSENQLHTGARQAA